MEKRGFLYHVPGLQAAPREKVWEVIPQLTGLGLSIAGCATGPAGAGGLICAVSGRGATVGFRPKEQRWVCAGAYWIGWDGEAPAPAQLARKRQVPGALLRLGDGHEWQIPRLRQFPWVYNFDASGQKVTEVAGEYRALFDDVMAQWNSEKTTYNDLLPLVSRAIGVNYVVGEGELVALRALGSVQLDECFNAITGMGDYMEAVNAAEVAEKNAECASTPDG